ncbi:MAG: SAM-dependent methyltransferase, partial [Trebonia sp.]
MTDEELRVPGIDATRPSVARVYDFWLGGKENFAVDREMGGRMAGVCEAGRWVAG